MTTKISEAASPGARADTERELVSVIVPIDSEVSGLEEMLLEVSGVLDREGWSHEFILVDDGTPSAEELARIEQSVARTRVLRFHQGFGEAVALSAGFEAAHGGYFLTLPPYQQVAIPDIVKLLERLEEGYDFVAGWRHPRVDPLPNRIQSSLFNFLARRFSRSSLHDLNCKLRAMRRRVPEEVEIYGDMFRFLPILASRKGFKITEVQLRHHSERGKVGFFGVGVYARRLLDLITMFFLIKFTKKPLRFFGLVGFGFMMIGVAICLYLSYDKIFQGAPLGGRPLLVLGVLMIVLGMQTISIGLIGEMIIFTHAKTLKEYQIDRFLQDDRARGAGTRT